MHSHPMDNPTYQRDAEKGVELLETKKARKEKEATNGTAQNTNQPPPISQASTSCKPEVCQAARSRYSPPELAGSPWHKKKTIYLITFLVLLGIWIIVFTTLSQMKLL